MCDGIIYAPFGGLVASAWVLFSVTFQILTISGFISNAHEGISPQMALEYFYLIVTHILVGETSNILLSLKDPFLTLTELLQSLPCHSLQILVELDGVFKVI